MANLDEQIDVLSGMIRHWRHREKTEQRRLAPYYKDSAIARHMRPIRKRIKILTRERDKLQNRLDKS